MWRGSGRSTRSTVGAAMDDVEDVRAAMPFAGVLERLRRRFGTPRNYVLVRWMILRLLRVVYLSASLVLLGEARPLPGARGLARPAGYVDQLRDAGQTFWDVPSLFLID